MTNDELNFRQKSSRFSLFRSIGFKFTSPNSQGRPQIIFPENCFLNNGNGESRIIRMRTKVEIESKSQFSSDRNSNNLRERRAETSEEISTCGEMLGKWSLEVAQNWTSIGFRIWFSKFDIWHPLIHYWHIQFFKCQIGLHANLANPWMTLKYFRITSDSSFRFMFKLLTKMYTMSLHLFQYKSRKFTIQLHQFSGISDMKTFSVVLFCIVAVNLDKFGIKFMNNKLFVSGCCPTWRWKGWKGGPRRARAR